MKAKILAVDDEKDILELVSYNLRKEGLEVVTSLNGEEAMKLIKKARYDMVILDLMLPGIQGMEFCKMLKHSDETAGIPVIMLTAKSEEMDKVLGLEIGADDYITKPFSPRVLVARVRSVLRTKKDPSRVEKSTEKIINIHEISIDTRKHVVTVDHKPVDLTFSEFRLLQLLAERPGWVYSRYQIVDALRGENYPVTERSVDVQIVGLRKKLGSAGKFIQTVRGVGYRFKE